MGALKGQVCLCKALHQILAPSQGQIVTELDGPVTGAVREEAIESGGACDAGGQPFSGLPKEFEEIAKTKEWKGETTAGCLYWLGLMEERQGHNNEAVAYYRRTYQAWKKYELWSAKAYLGAARLFATKLDQKTEAKALITEMLTKDRIKDTPEAAEARTLSAKL